MSKTSSIAALIVCLIVPLTAAADALDDARSEFEAGLTLLDDERFAEASAAFERSIQHHETVGAQYNLGLAQRGLGHITRAVASFERVLELAAPEDEALRSNAVALLEELLARVARLDLEVSGDPDSVTLDGEPVQPGEVRLDPGRHLILVRRAGFAEQREMVELAVGGHQTVSIDAAAQPLATRLTITVNPVDAHIRVDGLPRGRSGTELRLEPGDHRVQIEADGYETHERTVRLVPGVAERLAVHLSPSESEITSEAWFWVVLLGAAALIGGGIGLGIYLNQAPEYDGGSLDMVLFNLVEF